MKVFYGVQGTGNGHITRARVMAKELRIAGVEVQFQFTGRPADKYFDMDVFGDYIIKPGLTFNVKNGQVSYLKTALQNNPIQFIKDVRSLDLSDYDLVISDFEPVTAWAAKLQGIRCVGIGHQYAFQYEIPKAKSDPLADMVMKYFAPVDYGVGLHWHHFDQPILPPIIETFDQPLYIVPNRIVVYLPFEDQKKVAKLFNTYSDYDFYIYTPDCKEEYKVAPHITFKPVSREGFQQDVYDCNGVICNAGFELASEALQLGKKLLVKPVYGQMEQHSNAVALEELKYGTVMTDIETAGTFDVGVWLDRPTNVRVNYPNVARFLVRWIKSGHCMLSDDDITRVWQKIWL